MSGGNHTGKVWFVTGASSGFGRAIAKTALASGDRVVVSARSEDDAHDVADEYPERGLALALDVTDADMARSAVAKAVSTFGRVDVVVNNAGYGHVGAIEELSDCELRDQLEVNLFGVINVTRAALPHMREQRSGHLVQMSSLNGIEGLVGGGYYAASKFAIEGFSESLAEEVAHLGINVTIVEPGPHRTRFANDESARWASPIDDYTDSVGRAREAIKQLDGHQPGDPDRAADAIVAAVRTPSPPRRLPLGSLAVEHIGARLTAQLDDLRAWSDVSVSTDFPTREGERGSTS
ncbi:oxidoreductase [Actinoplanes sp. NPDC051513]|uniref:oxidoreductase n=1 Tax=Actinoplanes sp. NPDC051513 TaxID=3363908 RepID=UPI003797EA8C